MYWKPRTRGFGSKKIVPWYEGSDKETDTVTVTNLSQASLGRPSPRALKPRLRYKLNHGVVGGVYYNLYTRGARPGRVVCLCAPSLHPAWCTSERSCEYVCAAPELVCSRVRSSARLRPGNDFHPVFVRQL